MAESPRITQATQQYLPRTARTSDIQLTDEERKISPCEKCGVPYGIGDWPFCPHGRGTYQEIGDSIPGGISIEHGLCNIDGSPRTYYSHSEIKREAERRGFTNVVTHVPSPGSDKNKQNHTTRWI